MNAKPETGTVVRHAECVNCGESLLHTGNGWYHAYTGEKKCATFSNTAD